ncbi:MAG: hypothetical protein EZS28_011144 [Streblomastix strix]|uniref:Uncharacterized protein n=1 Tax=Streblomastix strix TaxID=222440 RepID=A0A5J4WEE5_9EUKA|nr:MAG: hypothetical protein EZS28_011144 [Streblomastix strix]
MYFVIILTVLSALCKNFVTLPPAYSTVQEFAFEGNNTSFITHNALSTSIGLTSFKSINDICQQNVGKTKSVDDSKQKVQDVLDLNPCQGYEIILVDLDHYESVTINKTQYFPVLIKGGSKNKEENEIMTVWGVNTSSSRTITLMLSIECCIFKGLGSQVPVQRMIYGYNSSKSNAEIIVYNTTFENINLTNTGNGVVYIRIEGSNSVVIINESRFLNVSSTTYIEISGSNSKITINGKTIVDIIQEESMETSIMVAGILTMLKGCIFDVDQKGDGISSKQTIKGALAGNCTNLEGYKITLLNNEHYESVTINKTQDFPVLIKGGSKNKEENEIMTVWGVNTSSSRTITLMLSIECCIFKGLGSQVPVQRMIYGYNSSKSNAEIIVYNTTFENINLTNTGNGVVYIRIEGSNSVVIINESRFLNVSSTTYIEISGSNSKITINGKTIVDVLARECNDAEGYQITLLNTINYESVTINKPETNPVLITSEPMNDKNNIHTAWGVNTSSTRTITLLQGDLTIQNIEFIYFESTNKKQDEQDEVIWPWNAVIYAFDSNFSNRILSLSSCIFKGLGSKKSVSKMIYAYDVKKLKSISGQYKKPVIQSSAEQEQDSPLMIVSGNGKVQIDGFIITHSNDDGKQAIIETSGESDNQKKSPFLFAAGKQIVIINVTMEPTSFIGCSGIILDGENEITNHSLVLETSTFQVPNNKNGFQSILDTSNFTIVIFDSIFSGFFGTQTQNADEEDTCEWSTSAIHLKDGEINFGNTTFTGLGDGALFVGTGAQVKISQSSLLYGNKPSGTNGRMTNFQRNIVCDGEEDKKAELKAELVSFIEKGKEGEQDEVSINRWILINKKTCKLSGSIANEKHLLYIPLIDKIEVEQTADKTEIQVVITGSSLFGCGKIWLKVSGQSSTSQDMLALSYNFEGIVDVWTSDTKVTLLIPFDDEIVKVGNKILIQAFSGDTAEFASPVPSSKGGFIEAVEIKIIKEISIEEHPDPTDPDTTKPIEDSKGISTGALIGIIIGAVLIVAVIVIIVVISIYRFRD